MYLCVLVEACVLTERMVHDPESCLIDAEVCWYVAMNWRVVEE